MGAGKAIIQRTSKAGITALRERKVERITLKSLESSVESPAGGGANAGDGAREAEHRVAAEHRGGAAGEGVRVAHAAGAHQVAQAAVCNR